MDEFGRSGALDGDIAVVGVPRVNSYSGAANIFDGSQGWAEVTKLVPTDSQPNQFGLFYMGGGELQAPFGDGLRCVGAGGAGLFRYNPPQHSGSAGMLTLGPGIVARSQSFSANGHIDAGETWYFQGWYRDPMGPCGTAFNLSNGLAVTFAP